MEVVAALDWGTTIGVIVLFAVFAWLLISGGTDSPSDPSTQSDDPNAPDEQGFTPADKYGYGYDYSWGDPYGDKDL